MTVNYIPAYATEYIYIVARECDGEFCFWGAWNDANKANEVALEIGGEVFDWEDLEDEEEDEEPSDWDLEIGFDVYEGCYSWDC